LECEKLRETGWSSSEICLGGNVKKATAVVTQNGCMRMEFFEGCETHHWEAFSDPSASFGRPSG